MTFSYSAKIGGRAFGVAHHLHHESLLGDEFVERHQAQDRISQFGAAHAIDADYLWARRPGGKFASATTSSSPCPMARSTCSSSGPNIAGIPLSTQSPYPNAKIALRALPSANTCGCSAAKASNSSMTLSICARIAAAALAVIDSAIASTMSRCSLNDLVTYGADRGSIAARGRDWRAHSR